MSPSQPACTLLHARTTHTPHFKSAAAGVGADPFHNGGLSNSWLVSCPRCLTQCAGAMKMMMHEQGPANPILQYMTPKMDGALKTFHSYTGVQLPVEQEQYGTIVFVAGGLELLGGLLFTLNAKVGAVLLVSAPIWYHTAAQPEQQHLRGHQPMQHQAPATGVPFQAVTPQGICISCVPPNPDRTRSSSSMFTAATQCSAKL